VAAIPRPPAVPLGRWLTAFPSFGFVLAVAPQHVSATLERFARRDIAAAVAGEVTAKPELRLALDGDDALFWDLADTPLTGCGTHLHRPETFHA
jgi:selenophosphate synthetase-related protein